MTHSALLALAASLAVVAVASRATAQDEVLHTLGFARVALANSDAQTDTRLRTIESLGRALPRAAGAHADEAHFLRAVAAADLLLIGGDAGELHVAEAWGCDRGALVDEVTGELGSFARSERFGAVARDAIAALRGPGGRLPPREGDHHLRAQLAALSRIRSAAEDAHDPVAALAALGVDPCPGRSLCDPPYDRFGPRGRRAVGAVQRALEYAAHLRDAAERGDPFCAAAVARGLVDTDSLRALRLSPDDWGSGLGVAPVSAAGAEVDTDVDTDAVIVVGRREVRFGWIPRVAFDEAGRPRTSGDGGRPLGEESGSFALSPELRSVAMPIDALVPALREALHGATSIGVAVENGVEGLTLSRVIYSALDARLAVRALIVPRVDGSVRGVPIRAADTERAPRTIGLYVRAGGFTVTGRGPVTSIPRVRAPRRGWRFDYATLRQTTTERPSAPLVVTYMTVADAATVLRATMAAWRPGVDVTLRLWRL